jgi:pyruvate, water dikinase
VGVTDLTRPLTAVGADQRLVAGGKGAGLGEMCQAGLPVPPGFVVTVQAFEQAMRAIDPSAAFAREVSRLPSGDVGAIERVTSGMRARITAVPLLGELADAITAGYRELTAPDEPDGAPVAVRSSATTEDIADASFAGLQDTYLWIRGAASVLAHVRRCWASLYNTEAVSYRLRQDLPEDGAAMAVVVQRMVDPRSAGVMFTCSPMTGDRSVVAIEASWGLGSVLVSGEVTPDSFVVSKVTGDIVRRTVASKLRLHRLDPAGSGTRAADVPPELRDQPCLADAEIRALARLAAQVERHFGIPQDIEWALTRDGDVHLLQSRAETVWATRAGQPLAVPKRSAMQHVFEQLGRPVLIREKPAE